VKVHVPPLAARVDPEVQVLESTLIGEETPERSEVRLTDLDPELVTVKD
jgi:hypothetical protein